MSNVTIGSGLGAFCAIAAQPTYGATFVTPTRALSFKTAKLTFDPHPVQGGPYLRGGTSLADLGSARVLTYTDAKVTLAGDVMNTGHALLLATAIGSSGALTQVGTTTAYQLGGSTGIVLGAPDKLNGGTSGCCFDMQIAAPDAGPTNPGTLHPYNLHSCMITKAEWTFDRTGIVSYSYDIDAQYVETTTSLITPTFAGAPTPFSFGNTSSTVKIGTFGSEAVVDGVRKVTITMTRKLDTNRIYAGNQYKDLPVTNGLVEIDANVDADFTSAAKTALFDLLLAGTPTSLVVDMFGNAIGSTTTKDEFKLNPSNLFVQTQGEPNLDGPDVIKNTLQMKGTIDAAGDSALSAALATADTGF